MIATDTVRERRTRKAKKRMSRVRTKEEGGVSAEQRAMHSGVRTLSRRLVCCYYHHLYLSTAFCGHKAQRLVRRPALVVVSDLRSSEENHERNQAPQRSQSAALRRSPPRRLQRHLREGAGLACVG